MHISNISSTNHHHHGDHPHGDCWSDSVSSCATDAASAVALSTMSYSSAATNNLVHNAEQRQEDNNIILQKDTAHSIHFSIPTRSRSQKLRPRLLSSLEGGGTSRTIVSNRNNDQSNIGTITRYIRTKGLQKANASTVMRRFLVALTSLFFLYLLIQHQTQHKSNFRKQAEPSSTFSRIKAEHSSTFSRIHSTSSLSSSASSASSPSTSSLPSRVAISAIESMYKGHSLPFQFVCDMFRNSKHYLESLPSVVNVTIPSSPQLFQLDNLDNNSKEEVDPEQAHDQEKENEAPVISSSSQHHATIVGDIHGRFHSLMHIFQMNGFPSPTNPYILVGDLVDKGQSSIQVLLTVIMIQLSCPQCIHFVRGNHEVQSMYRKNMEKNIKAMYNGERKNEVTTLQEQELYSLIVDTIQEIPLAVALQGSCHGKYDDAVRSNNAFIMHGGLVGYDLTIDHIAKIKRGRDPEYDSFFQNLIWAHPQPEIGLTINEHWSSFGPDVTGSFIRRNGLSLLIRGHTYEQEGYSVQHDAKVITLHSAPAIGKEDGHKGAVLNLNACFDRDFFQFGPPPHRLIGDFTPFLDFDVNRGGNDDKQKMQ